MFDIFKPLPNRMRRALLCILVWCLVLAGNEAQSQDEKPCGKSELVQFYAVPLAADGPLKEEYVIGAAISFKPGIKEIRLTVKIASNKRSAEETQTLRKSDGYRQRFYGEPGGLMGYGWEGVPTVTVVKCEEIKDAGYLSQPQKLSADDSSALFAREMLWLAKDLAKAKDWRERNKLFAQKFPVAFAKLADKQNTTVQKLLDNALAAGSEEERLLLWRAAYAFCARSAHHEGLSAYFKERWETNVRPDKKAPEVEKKEISKDGRFWVAASGVITDTRTGLEWYVEPEQEKRRSDEDDKVQDTNWYGAKSWVDYLTVDGGGWRMPTRSELLNLYQKGKGNRNLDPVFKTKGWVIWTGEVDESDNSYVWAVDFYYGRTVMSPRRQTRVRSLPGDCRAFAVRAPR